MSLWVKYLDLCLKMGNKKCIIAIYMVWSEHKQNRLLGKLYIDIFAIRHSFTMKIKGSRHDTYVLHMISELWNDICILVWDQCIFVIWRVKLFSYICTVICIYLYIFHPLFPLHRDVQSVNVIKFHNASSVIQSIVRVLVLGTYCVTYVLSMDWFNTATSEAESSYPWQGAGGYCHDINMPAMMKKRLEGFWSTSASCPYILIDLTTVNALRKEYFCDSWSL